MGVCVACPAVVLSGGVHLMAVSSPINLSQAVYPLTGASLITHTQSLRFTVILVQSAVWSSLECFPACLRGYPVLWSLPRGVNVSTFVSSPPEFHLSLSHAQVGGGGVFNGNWYFLSTYAFDSQGIHEYSAPSRRSRHVMAAAYRGQERLKPAPAPEEVTNAEGCEIWCEENVLHRESCLPQLPPYPRAHCKSVFTPTKWTTCDLTRRELSVASDVPQTLMQMPKLPEDFFGHPTATPTKVLAVALSFWSVERLTESHLNDGTSREGIVKPHVRAQVGNVTNSPSPVLDATPTKVLAVALSFWSVERLTESHLNDGTSREGIVKPHVRAQVGNVTNSPSPVLDSSMLAQAEETLFMPVTDEQLVGETAAAVKADDEKTNTAVWDRHVWLLGLHTRQTFESFQKWGNKRGGTASKCPLAVLHNMLLRLWRKRVL
jgi:hypothetical protein